MITPDQISEEARTWVGVPFLHQGRSHQGVDCIGLVIEVGKSLGILPSEFKRGNYSRLPVGGRLLVEIAEKCTEVKVAEPGTLIVIQWSRDPYHIAICTGPTLIHASSSIGKVVEHGYRHPWPKLTMSIWRMPGVIYE